jgi:hypothetical protein
MLLVIVQVAVAMVAIFGILLGGVEGGGRMTWPVVVSLIGVVGMVDWLRLRNSTRNAQAVADRLIAYTVLLLIAVWVRF